VMKCRNPYTQGMHAYPCGQCMPCRYNRRRLWQSRIMLESLCYSDNAFVTLTYAEDKLPVGMSLVPKDLQDWLKRFRAAISPLKIRYYGVGEYGDINWRPHYHVALFGYPSCTCCVRNSGQPTSRWFSCPVCSLVHDTWGRGIIHHGELSKHSAGYIAGYVTKKMTSVDDPRLEGKHPEFCRMSLKPGIGANFMFEPASVTMQYGLDVSEPDAPAHLLVGGKPMPIGRYLRQKYRLYIGKDKNAPQSTLDEHAEEMRPLFMAARASAENPSFKKAVIKAGDQRVLQDETRRNIYKRRRSL